MASAEETSILWLEDILRMRYVVSKKTPLLRIQEPIRTRLFLPTDLTVTKVEMLRQFFHLKIRQCDD